MNIHRVALSLSSVAILSTTLLMALSACATTSDASSRHLRVVNATYDDMTALAFAPSGSMDFREVTLARPLTGALGSVTVDVPSGACVRDVRVTLHGDRTLLYPHMDVCRHDGLRLAVGARPERSTSLKDAPEAAGSP
ncbi:hypothetical protein [Dyella sp. C11]|uniref:hypothetical protein n=1 Tax=Dyella sp. C11 TaxID=2126991 RepID=UPI000D657D97|nr:hypothetical protein [Dyella sp. C11]